MSKLLDKFKRIRERKRARREDIKRIEKNLGKIDREIREIENALKGERNLLEERGMKEDMPDWIKEKMESGVEQEVIGIEGNPSEVILEQRLMELKRIRRGLREELSRL